MLPRTPSWVFRGLRAGLLVLGWIAAMPAFAAASYLPSTVVAPEPSREFRGMWVATVNNIDWPSRPGLSTRQQQTELLAILDRAVQLRFNAVIFQVRPACDALYASRYEPWSEYLTGQMGRAPAPFYDPLSFAVQAAHERGLELHAWFNPFRARHTTGKSPVAPDHVSRTQPHLVRTYNGELWLDPGEKAVQEHSLRVILDVVRCYDIDAVHLDNYFYPYPEKDAKRNPVDFPDGTSWKKYVESGGKLSRTEWRRDNVDRFIQRLYQAVKAEKARVKVGISPFGIWRPGYPADVRGFDAYAGLYADSRKWLAQGWLDYLAPQLYWPVDARQQSFASLVRWWAEQNPKGRQVWPGGNLYAVGAGREASEIVRQIRLTRLTRGVGGYIHWSARCLLQNRGRIAETLTAQVYTEPALVPAFPWLDRTPPAQPTLKLLGGLATSPLKLMWTVPGADAVGHWLVQTKVDGRWQTEILPGRQTAWSIPASRKPEVLVVRAVDRCGNLSPPAALERQAVSPRRGRAN